MHSHDRTLLAKLGFADPDKQDRRHDLACQYLALPENLRRLADLIYPARDEPVNESEYQYGAYKGNAEDERLQRRGQQLFRVVGFKGAPQFEAAVSKGEGQYKTTIGFIDLAATVSIEVAKETESRSREWLQKESSWPKGYLNPEVVTRTAQWANWSDWRPDTTPHQCFAAPLVIEVKIHSVGTGEILRQINLYREYPSPVRAGRDHGWVVATLFALSAPDVAQLRTAGIHHARLGSKFEQYLVERQSTPPPSTAESPEV